MRRALAWGWIAGYEITVSENTVSERASDWKVRLRATHVSTVEGLALYRVAPGVYVQEVRGHLSAEVMERSLRTAWDRADFQTPYGVVHVLDDRLTYDADMRSFPDRPNIVPAVASVVVTDNRLWRMVVSAIGIASRIKRGTRVNAYDNVFEAVDEVRRLVTP